LDNPENKAILAKTVTVEVSARQAVAIAIAAEAGKISLSLRSNVSGAVNSATETPVEAGVAPEGSASLEKIRDEVLGDGFMSDNDLGDQHGSPGVSQTVRIMRGDQIETIEFLQDGHE
jgi:hypothetical protein